MSDTPDSQLVLKANPHYWQKGLPYLKTLTFKSVASDEAAYEAMLANSGQAYEGMSTPQLVPSFKSHFIVTAEPSTSPYNIQLNTKIPPFNNILAREAIYYATDAAALDSHLFGDTYPVTESFTAKAGLLRADGARLHRLTTWPRPRRWSSNWAASASAWTPSAPRPPSPSMRACSRSGRPPG